MSAEPLHAEDEPTVVRGESAAWLFAWLERPPSPSPELQRLRDAECYPTEGEAEMRMH